MTDAATPQVMMLAGLLLASMAAQPLCPALPTPAMSAWLPIGVLVLLGALSLLFALQNPLLIASLIDVI